MAARKDYLKTRGARDMLRRAAESCCQNPFVPNWYVDDEHNGQAVPVDEAIRILTNLAKVLDAEVKHKCW